MNNLQDQYLGVGLKFPISIDQFGRGEYESGLSLVAQDIKLLLSTAVGEQFFLPEYGSRLEEVLFEPNNEIAKALIRTFVEEAVAQWEKRVKFIDIDFEFGENGLIQCALQYEVLATSRVESFIYPFYRQLKY